MSKTIKKRESLADIPLSVCLFFIIGGLLIGNVMVIGTWHWGKPITRNEAVLIEATFDSYEEVYHGRGGSRSARILFSDYRDLNVNTACYKEEVANRLDTLPSGSRVQILLHPNSDDIWELKMGEYIVLSFEDSTAAMQFENISFTILGVFMYALGIFGVIVLVAKCVKNRKSKKQMANC